MPPPDSRAVAWVKQIEAAALEALRDPLEHDAGAELLMAMLDLAVRAKAQGGGRLRLKACA
jgi:hypothetical protein